MTALGYAFNTLQFADQDRNQQIVAAPDEEMGTPWFATEVDSWNRLSISIIGLSESHYWRQLSLYWVFSYS